MAMMSMMFNVREALLTPPPDGPIVAALEAGPDLQHMRPIGRLIVDADVFQELAVMCAWHNFELAREQLQHLQQQPPADGPSGG